MQSPSSIPSAPRSLHAKTPLSQEEQSRRYASHDRSRHPAPPEPNVPSYGGDFQGCVTDPSTFTSSQQPGHPQPSLPPPHRLPVSPTHLLGGHESAAPRVLGPIPPQPGTGHVNDHTRPPDVFPHANVPDSAQLQPYLLGRFVTPGRPDVSEPPYPPVPSYGFVSSHASERSPPHVYVSVDHQKYKQTKVRNPTMIEVLPDETLLKIFRHNLYTSPQFWPTLIHVCRKWRQIVLSSPLGLRLRLYCTYGTPVSKTLDCWPPFPLVVNYGGFPPAPEDEKNIIVALKQSDRVGSICLTITNSLMENLPVVSGPFSELEELVLLTEYIDDAQLVLPNSFRWGPRLRYLHLTRIAIPALPQLLSPSTGLVDLQLHEIPDIGYFSPYAFADALSEMTQLQTLVLHFLSLPPSRNDLDFPPQSRERVVLPALTCLKYRGTSKYLDSLVARIDAPCLRDIDITFFSQPTLDALQLGLFIGRIEMQASPLQANIIPSWGDISITFAWPDVLTRLELQISCGELDLQLSSISQICDHFSPFLFNVEELSIDTIEASTVPDDMDDEQWLRLIRAFGGVKDFYVTGELATDILRALCSGEGHETVLPALRWLHLQEPLSRHGSFWDPVDSFLAQCQLSGRPVQLHYHE